MYNVHTCKNELLYFVSLLKMKTKRVIESVVEETEVVQGHHIADVGLVQGKGGWSNTNMIKFQCFWFIRLLIFKLRSNLLILIINLDTKN